MILFICISYDRQLRQGKRDQKLKVGLSFCHLNLNGLATHNFIKVSLLQALGVTYDYHICLLETFLDLSISNEDERIRIEGFNLLWMDHPSNKKEEVFVCTIKNIFLLQKEATYVP